MKHIIMGLAVLTVTILPGCSGAVGSPSEISENGVPGSMSSTDSSGSLQSNADTESTSEKNVLDYDVV